MLQKRLQLGLVHLAVAMTLVPINSTLNRVMIKELSISATLVAAMASLPYLFSPVQVAIGSFSDRHPLWGLHRTPYILLGLLLCVGGVIVSPQIAFTLVDHFWPGLLIGVLAFGAWGVGYNLAAVAYLSLATEISGHKARGGTIAVMWFMMILGIIFTAITLSRLVDPYTEAALRRSFWIVGAAALGLGLAGLIGLESRTPRGQHIPQEGAAITGAESRQAPLQAGGFRGVERERFPEKRYSWAFMASAILGNRQARLFLLYLIILLAALLGQDILLEPFAAEAFEMTVRETTRITSFWGTFVLIALALTGWLERRMPKRRLAAWGGWGAFAGFGLITLSGILKTQGVFYAGVFFLGIGTGVSTVSNLSLMLDMTVAGQVGLFVGAWGMANAISRLIGSVLGGVGRDVIAQVSGRPVLGYVIVFGIMAAFMLVSLIMLARIDVAEFQENVPQPPVVERAAIAGDV